MALSLWIVNSQDHQLAELASISGFGVAASGSESDLLGTAKRPAGPPPDVVLVDTRATGRLPDELEAFHRSTPAVSLILVATTLEVGLMRQAMRLGVTECLTAPLSAEDLRTAVTRVRLAAGAQMPKAQIFAFTGGHGGIGTTSIAINVAAALATGSKASVAYLDLELLEPGDAALFFGVEPRYSVLDVLNNVHRLDLPFLRGLMIRAECGVDVIAAPLQPQGCLPELAELRVLMDWVASAYDYVIVDLPRPVPALLELVKDVSAVVLVVVQQLAAVRAASAMAAELRQVLPRDRIVIALNRHESGSDIGRDDIERVLGMPVNAVLPNDYPAASAAANSGRPLVLTQRNRLAKALRELTHTLESLAPSQSGAARTLVGAGADR